MTKMRFGAVVAPFHTHHDQNPTVALHRDLEMAMRLDQLGYDEVWFGEHHSGGTAFQTEGALKYVAEHTAPSGR